MGMGILTALTLLTLPLGPMAAQRDRKAPDDSATRVMVGTDYLVSRDGDAPHVEVMAAANPRDARNLIAGAITYTRSEGGTATKAYVTHDGGVTWSDVAFAEQRRFGGGDPQVTFTSAGTAIFATLTPKADETGRTRAYLHAYRSEDAGTTWGAPFDLGASYDHPMLTSDHTTGRYAGRLYMAVLYGRQYSLGVFRSEDDGRSWIGPVKFIDGEGKRGLNVDQTIVLSDGSLVVPFVDFPSTPAQDSVWKVSRLYTVLSADGGVTFSPPRPGPGPVGTARRVLADRQLAGSFAYAADPSPRFRDRIYCVWTDFSRGAPRVLISWSIDRGQTWSAPKTVAQPSADSTKQFQAAVAVNRDGILGVTWYDTRGATSGLAFHELFAASLDGGATFTEPARVSSAISIARGSGNLLLSPSSFTGLAGEMRVSFISAASRWLAGGDYMGLTTDASGDFHPVWADARSGSYQLHTARVRVVRESSRAVTAAPNDTARLGAPTDITRRIDLVSDPGHYDAATQELELWVRIKNVSGQAIRGPIRLEVRKFGSGMGEMNADAAPEILSSSNGMKGAGAVFTYEEALGSDGVLPPGGVSGAILWRLKLRDAERVPDFHVYITGRLAR